MGWGVPPCSPYLLFPYLEGVFSLILVPRLFACPHRGPHFIKKLKKIQKIKKEKKKSKDQHRITDLVTQEQGVVMVAVEKEKQ